MTEIAISVNHVSKCFKRYRHPVDRLKEIFVPGKSLAHNFWALQDINLEVWKVPNFRGCWAQWFGKKYPITNNCWNFNPNSRRCAS